MNGSTVTGAEALYDGSNHHLINPIAEVPPDYLATQRKYAEDWLKTHAADGAK